MKGANRAFSLTDWRLLMVLSDVDLLAALSKGDIQISPAPDIETQLGACSLDLRLGEEFRVFERARTAFIDPREGINWDAFTRVVTVPDGEPFIMHPSELVLAATVEEITLPADMLGRLEGRSSLGRLGIIVHGTAPMFFPGFSGRCVMELGKYRADAGRALSQHEDLLDDLRADFVAVFKAVSGQIRRAAGAGRLEVAGR